MASSARRQCRTRHFDRKVDAQKGLKDAMASVVRGDHVAPKVARLTVGEWSDKWLDGYRTRRESTVRQAEVTKTSPRAPRSLRSTQPTTGGRRKGREWIGARTSCGLVSLC